MRQYECAGRNMAGRRFKRANLRSFLKWIWLFRDLRINVKTSPVSCTDTGPEKKSAKIQTLSGKVSQTIESITSYINYAAKK